MAKPVGFLLGVLRKTCLTLALSASACTFDPTGTTTPPALGAKLSELTAKVRTSPDDLEARVALAEAQLATNQLFAAADLSKETAERWPKDPRAYATLADAYDRLGYFMKGFEALRRCLDTMPGNDPCTVSMAFLLLGEGSDFAQKEARRMLRTFVANTKDHPRLLEAQSTLALLEKKLGPDAPDSAVAEGATPSEPANPHGAGFGVAGQNPHAGVTGAPPAGPVDLIPGHGGAQPGDPDVGDLNDFGRALARAMDATRRQDAAGAENAFRDALKIRPEDPSANAGLAETLLVQGKIDEAVLAATRAYSLAPGEPQTRWTFGIVMTKSGRDIAAGVEAWRALVRDTPDVAAQVGVQKFIEEYEKSLGAGKAPPLAK
ncbi:MAG: tetratricopeptide repeat protein [Deltaproteobacteria bacterium]|nr:tetratricopeptide repeat protein [Deltaproteobacteria bacterium]